MTALEQPYVYARRELLEPDWTRFPGWRDVTTEQWEDVQWQRVNCVKNIKQLRELMGDLLEERFYADLERDQQERATMSMLVPPQMLNTMVSEMTWADGRMPAAGAEFTDAFYADPIRAYMLPVFSDRRTDWPSHPFATRDSLHEHDMWAVEGLTHRYPTKVLAEMLPTCPPVLRSLHPHGPRRQLDPPDREAQAGGQAGRPLRRDAGLSPADPGRA